MPPCMCSDHKPVARFGRASRDAMRVGSCQQRRRILRDLRHRVSDELRQRMARNPAQSFIGLISQQRGARHRGQDLIDPFQGLKTRCDALGVRRQHRTQMPSQVRELNLAVRQQSGAFGHEVMPDKPGSGTFRAVQFIDQPPAGERNDAVDQRQAQVLGSSRSDGQWDLPHVLTVSVAI